MDRTAIDLDKEGSSGSKVEVFGPHRDHRATRWQWWVQGKEEGVANQPWNTGGTGRLEKVARITSEGHLWQDGSLRQCASEETSMMTDRNSLGCRGLPVDSKNHG